MSTEIPKLKISKTTQNKHLIKQMIKTLGDLLNHEPEKLNQEKIKHLSELVNNLNAEGAWTFSDNVEGEVCCEIRRMSEIKRLEKLRINLEKEF